MGAVLLIYREKYLAADAYHLAFIVFTPHLLQSSLSLKYGSCILNALSDVPLQYYSLHFASRGFLQKVSIGKGSLFDEGLEIHFCPFLFFFFIKVNRKSDR